MTTSQSRKIILVTGGNRGIGLATATALARLHTEVFIAARNSSHTATAVKNIRALTGNKHVWPISIDLSDLRSVRNAANRFLQQDKPIHALINNAGVAGTSGLSIDGFEITFATNYLGHFLFTEMLRDRLRESAPSVVINISSRP